MKSLKESTRVCDTLQAYVMCGGGGTRLWPLSRADNPKQNLNLTSSRSMLDETIMRFLDSDISGVVSTVNLMGGSTQTNAMMISLNQATGSKGGIILEPFGKNTAPAVAIASLHAAAQPGDPYVLILPSDHVIQPIEKFSAAISAGLDAADDGRIVVFGIEPHSPATGYGYIEVAGQEKVLPVQSFREKPDLETAKAYAKSGKHLWNAGIFLFRASTMLAALKVHAPEILATCTNTIKRSSAKQDNILKLDPNAFKDVPADSIDFAVMEHARNVSVVRADFEWHDVGSFASLHNLRNQHTIDATHYGDVISTDCANTMLHSEGPLIGAVGLNNVAVIATPDVVLVTSLDGSEDVKKIVTELEESGRSEILRTPWLQENGVQPGIIGPKVKSWLMSHALPYWAQNGCDVANGGYHEVLGFDGKSVGADKRLRTMARQIFTYAKAIEMGWEGDALQTIQSGLQFLTDSPAERLGGWSKTFTPESNVLNTTEDIYDHAFILSALAQCKQVGVEFDDVLIDRTIGVIDALRVTSNGSVNLGYAEDSANTLPRRSNPHMHLLEAFLAWHRASGDVSYLRRAKEIVELFQSHFYDGENLFLGELFDKKLEFSGGGISQIEPGHHFEWARLLLEYALRSGEQPVS